jgi:hypothetical protein
MMTGTITDDQARALAQLVALLSGDKRWDVAGVRSALSKARHKAPAADLAIAAIRCATNPDAKYPVVIGMDGPHWSAGTTVTTTDHRYARCPEPGHTSFPAWNCAACRSEKLAADDTQTQTPTLAISRDQAAINERGAANAKRALAAHTARTTTKETS